jgi:hypothetical protein
MSICHTGHLAQRAIEKERKAKQKAAIKKEEKTAKVQKKEKEKPNS